MISLSSILLIKHILLKLCKEVVYHISQFGLFHSSKASLVSSLSLDTLTFLHNIFRVSKKITFQTCTALNCLRGTFI